MNNTIYPVDRFIKDDLQMSVNSFAAKTQIPQTTFSSWKSRNKPIISLPIQLLDELTRLSNMTIEEVRTKLAIYEKEASTFSYIDSMVLQSADMWTSFDDETKEKYASFQDFYKQYLKDEENQFWNDQTLAYQDEQIKKYIDIMKADLINQWSADGYLDEVEGSEIDFSGNFIDSDGEYTQIMGFNRREDLDRFLSQDFEDFIRQNPDFLELDEDGRDFWLTKARCNY